MKITKVFVSATALALGVAMAAAFAPSPAAARGDGHQAERHGVMNQQVRGAAHKRGNDGQMMGHGQMMRPGQMMGSGGGPASRPGAGDRVVPIPHLSIEDVRHFFEHRLTSIGFDQLEVGSVEAADEMIAVEIVAADGTVVQAFEVDPHSGAFNQQQ